MASSTTMPRLRIKANREIMLSVVSNWGISANAPRNEIGMPMVTQNARRASRNTLNSIMTSTSPMAALRRSSSMRCR